MSSESFIYKLSINHSLTNHIHSIYIYEQDLALNNLQWLKCHKTRPNQRNQSYLSEVLYVKLIDRSNVNVPLIISSYTESTSPR